MPLPFRYYTSPRGDAVHLDFRAADLRGNGPPASAAANASSASRRATMPACAHAGRFKDGPLRTR